MCYNALLDVNYFPDTMSHSYTLSSMTMIWTPPSKLTKMTRNGNKTIPYKTMAKAK